MVDTIAEEVIKAIFRDKWIAAGIVIVITIVAIRFVCKNNLPGYFKRCLIICMVSIAALVESNFFQWDCIFNTQRIKKFFVLVLLLVITITVITFFYKYKKIDGKLRDVIKNTEPNGNIIEAWKSLQEIKTASLTPWQKKQYDKRRLYLRVVLGNMCGAEQELKKFADDNVFYHYMKAVIFYYKGNHKEELEEAQIAESWCNGDTDSFLYFQIIENRGVGYVGVGEYSLANDCFKRAIEFGKEKNLKDPNLWLTAYYNYIFNKTRIDREISIQKCLDMLEDVKKYIDIENPKQYIGYRNVVIELLRQKKVDRVQISEIVNQDFEYLINSNLTNTEKCILEATTARMACTGRLDPSIVTEKMSKDIKLFLQLPMPEKYRCFKEIDYMFKDLRGLITEVNREIKETAHWYIVNQAAYDLENYRSELPSEAVYEICWCLQERAGLLKYKSDQYVWNEFLKDMHSAQMLYKENELLADSVLCGLNIMDEALSEHNVDSELKPLYLDTIKSSLQEIEEILPQLMEHPILNEIYLRLSIYCFAIDDIKKSKCYYEKFQNLGNFAIDHFAPWLRGRYFVISFYMVVIEYIEVVNKIAEKDLSREISQVQDWFKGFHNRNGFYETIVLGRVLGKEIIPMYLEMNPGKQMYDDVINVGDIKSTWLVIPELQIKIKCNESLSGKMFDRSYLLPDVAVGGLRYCNVNMIMPDMKKAIDRITEMIKAELPDYLISSEELKRLARECWFNISE